MAQQFKNYEKWCITRHGAGVKRRVCKAGRMPLRRLTLDMKKGYCVNSMGLCYSRWMKLRLGGRKICVARNLSVLMTVRQKEEA
jgi:hypothetical protein